MKIFKRDPAKRMEKEARKIEKQLVSLKEKRETSGVVKENLKQLSIAPGGRYIKRDSGLPFMWVVLLSIIILIGIVIFFNEKFSNLNDQLEAEKADLEVKIAELQKTSSILDETTEELEVKASREEKLSEEFISTKRRKEELEEEKNTVETQLAEAKQELEDAEYEITKLKSRNDALEDKIRKLEGK
jgi:hypothetical protein